MSTRCRGLSVLGGITLVACSGEMSSTGAAGASGAGSAMGIAGAGGAGIGGSARSSQRNDASLDEFAVTSMSDAGGDTTIGSTSLRYCPAAAAKGNTVYVDVAKGTDEATGSAAG